MKITPMDINNKEFKKGIRGYNTEEVDEFLDEVVDNFEEVYKENSHLKEKIAVLNEKLDHYSKIENTIQNTLLLAQNAAEQAKNSSQKEAEMLIKNANDTAQKILDKAHEDVIHINDEYDKLKQEFVKFRAKFRNFMNTQLETFDDLEKDVIKTYNIAAPVQENFQQSIQENIEEREIAIEEAAAEEETAAAVEAVNNSISSDLDQIKSFFANK
ncbi:MAG: DivIVA domain-containing protein [Clostridiaceae bacterium]